MNDIAQGIAGNLLDSGSLVITALMLVIIVLCVWIVMLYRGMARQDDELHALQKENIRLTDLLIELTRDGYSALNGVSGLRDKIHDIWRNTEQHD